MSRVIRSVKIKRELDTDPDLSYLGEFHSDRSKVNEHTIERNSANGREHKYFNPAQTAEDTGNPNSEQEDYERMEAYESCDWHMIGIWAEAEIQLVKHGVIQRIRSGGLWGIESDSEEDYFAEVAKEQLAELGSELKLIGFSKAAIAKAFAKAEEVAA